MSHVTKILGTTLTIWAALAGLAAAATLTLTSNSLATGSATVSSCGASSLSATRNVDNSGNVTRVDVYGIPQSCSGKTLSLTLKSQTGSALGSTSTAIGACTGGCTVTFTGFGGVAGSSLYGYAFALAG